MALSYKHTQRACYLGYITQAIINNLPPLLFIIFQNSFGISLSQISLLITVNFGIQMLVDLFSARFVDKIGYRPCVVAAHILSVIGLVGLTILPQLLGNAYLGLLIAVTLSAIGGGLLEVLISPITQSLPSEEKAATMSLLHSFYCWGHVAVVLLTTLFFAIAGRDAWWMLPILWAILPLLNTFLFIKVPMLPLVEEGQSMPIKKLLALPLFWLFFALMLCAGASEQAMSQWASLFAEQGLGVSKTVGDLMGPCAFAALMGTSRVYFSRQKRLKQTNALLLSGGLCIFSYLLTTLIPSPIVSLIGCALCGFSVGLMWPGVFSLAAEACPQGGTALFALLALAGDVGCVSGPLVVGTVSDSVLSGASSLIATLFPALELSQAALKTGFFFAIVFPVGLILGILALRRRMIQK